MTALAVLVPVLARPHRVQPLLDAIEQTTPSARVLFLADPDDLPEQRAIHAAGAEHALIDGGYAKKINAGVRLTTEPLILLAADDVTPHPGWFATASAKLTGRIQVVGLNDLIPRPRRPRHATHFLLTRSYAEQPCIDGTRGPLCEMYGHWCTDDELIATAKKRRAYTYARDAILEHTNHPMTGGPDDETYVKGRSTARIDNRVFRHRSRLWEA